MKEQKNYDLKTEVNPDTDETVVTVTRTIHFKEGETNQATPHPATQTIEFKQTPTGEFYYVNHVNKENTSERLVVKSRDVAILINTLDCNSVYGACRISYADIAQELVDMATIIKDRKTDQSMRMTTVDSMREQLIRCAMDKELEDLTQIYRNKPSDESPLGYDPVLISHFIYQLRKKYPKDSGDLLFDINNAYHRDALELVLDGILEGIPVNGVAMQPTKDDTYRIVISGVTVGTYTKLPNSYATNYTVKPAKLAELVTKNPDLNGRINQRFDEE